MLQTTFTTIIELEDSYLVSYLGNGSILYIRGDFWSFWGRRWPWCVTDLMIGHSFLNETGKETLYGIVGPSGLTARVRCLQLWKDTECGEILALCSDGISSPDNLRVGNDTHNKLWIEVNPHIDVFINTILKQYFENTGRQITPLSLLEKMTPVESMARHTETLSLLENTLEDFLEGRIFDDDATLGVLISPRAREHYLEKGPGK